MKKNFREFFLKSERIVKIGKNAKNNEELISQVLPDEIVLHTKAKGSPFANIKGKADEEDIKEAAMFCAYYSQDWKHKKKDVLVHYFRGQDIYKEKHMGDGTYGVKSLQNILVTKEKIIELGKRIKIIEEFVQELEKLKKLKLPEEDYAIFGSGPLAIRGLRRSRDLDIIVRPELFEKMKKNYKQNLRESSFNEKKYLYLKIKNMEFSFTSPFLDDDTTIGFIQKSEQLYSLSFVKLKDVLNLKKSLGKYTRDKDKKDIELIEKYLK